jgi:two-component system, NtrC family, sensor kinase
MRNIFITLLLLFSAIQPCLSQSKVIDSLNHIVRRTESDTTRILLMIDLASIFQFHNSDSALIIIDKAINQAQRLGYKRGELRAISRRGELHHLRGEYPLALEDELEVIRLTQKYHYPDIEAESLTFLATIYLDLAEYRQALHYLFRAKKLYDNIDIKMLFGGAQQIAPYTILSIGRAYEKLEMLDSAKFFYDAVFAYPVISELQQQADLLIKIGIVERRKKDYTDAINHFKRALKITVISNDLLNRSDALYQLALIFKEQKKNDSATYYAISAYKTGNISVSRTTTLDASYLLSSLYKERGNLDSAFYYQQLAITTKDSLFGLDKFHKLQLLSLAEQQRIQQLKEEQVHSKTQMQLIGLSLFVAASLLIALVLWRTNKQQKQANYLLNEKNQQIESQSESLKKTLSDLKSTQKQLIQSEKMASLGELTAGIAHEIQNPLNFVNNFSEVNSELIDELEQEANKGNIDEVRSLARNIKENEQKIVTHGRRADAIVKGMLQHSRSSSGQKELTDLNALSDEYLRLAYHGLRAKDKSFNAKFETHLDPSLPKVNVAAQDIGRVILNLINNAFYAVNEKQKQNIPGYEPVVSVTTIHSPSSGEGRGEVIIKVKDNGSGIPQKNTGQNLSTLLHHQTNR